LNRRESRDQRHAWLPEINDGTKGEIGGNQPKKQFAKNRPPLEAHQRKRERKHENRFVEGGRVTRNSIAEVNCPWERGANAIRAVRKTAEETADSSDSGAQCNGNGKEIARRLQNAEPTFLPFDSDPSPNQCADDRLAARKILRVRQLTEGSLWIFEPEEYPAADNRADDGSCGEGPSCLGGDVIAQGAPTPPIDEPGDKVRRQLEKEMRMNAQATKRNPDGKRQGAKSVTERGKRKGRQFVLPTPIIFRPLTLVLRVLGEGRRTRV
jgi:hypothetical protein